MEGRTPSDDELTGAFYAVCELPVEEGGNQTLQMRSEVETLKTQATGVEALDRSSAPLTKKLSLKPGQKLLLMGAPPGYMESLGPMPAGVTLVASGKVDAVQAFAKDKAEMKAVLSRAKAALNPGGMIWLTYPKGASKRFKSEINRDMIRGYAEGVGLETVALVAIDDDWSAIRCKAV